MFQPSFLIEQRRYVRVQLHLPARLRWVGPLGQVVEVTDTLDVSRGGALVYRSESCEAGALVWVTVPFQADTNDQPEIAARVVRVKTTATGGHLLAIEFEQPKRAVRTVGHFNRRGAERMPLAMPVSVWMGNFPWPEETMTVDVSDGGMMFRSARHYELGEIVRVAGKRAPLADGEARHARVVRIEELKGNAQQRIALSFFPRPPR